MNPCITLVPQCFLISQITLVLYGVTGTAPDRSEPMYYSKPQCFLISQITLVLYGVIGTVPDRSEPMYYSSTAVLSDQLNETSTKVIGTAPDQ